MIEYNLAKHPLLCYSSSDYNDSSFVLGSLAEV